MQFRQWNYALWLFAVNMVPDKICHYTIFLNWLDNFKAANDNTNELLSELTITENDQPQHRDFRF